MQNALVHQFRVTLRDVEPAVWRQIQTPTTYSFWDLHVAIQDSMGWLDYHLHAFRMKKPRGRKVFEIGLPDEYSEGSAERPERFMTRASGCPITTTMQRPVSRTLAHEWHHLAR